MKVSEKKRSHVKGDGMRTARLKHHKKKKRDEVEMRD